MYEDETSFNEERNQPKLLTTMSSTSLDQLTTDVYQHYQEVTGDKLDDACLGLPKDFAVNVAVMVKYNPLGNPCYVHLGVSEWETVEILEDICFFHDHDELGLHTKFIYKVPYGDTWLTNGLRPREDCDKLEGFLMEYFSVKFPELKWKVEYNSLKKKALKIVKEAEKANKVAESSPEPSSQKYSAKDYLAGMLNILKTSKSSLKNVVIGGVVLATTLFLLTNPCGGEEQTDPTTTEERSNYKDSSSRKSGIRSRRD